MGILNSNSKKWDTARQWEEYGYCLYRGTICNTTGTHICNFVLCPLSKFCWSTCSNSDITGYHPTRPKLKLSLEQQIICTCFYQCLLS